MDDSHAMSALSCAGQDLLSEVSKKNNETRAMLCSALAVQLQVANLLLQLRALAGSGGWLQYMPHSGAVLPSTTSQCSALLFDFTIGSQLAECRQWRGGGQMKWGMEKKGMQYHNTGIL